MTLISHINRLKERNYTIISIVAEAFGKIRHPFIKKKLSKLVIKENLFNLINATYINTLHGVKLNALHLGLETKPRKSAATLPVQ